MQAVGAGTSIKKRPIFNENIFYQYEWDKTPMEMPKAPEGIPLDKFIRENTGIKNISSLNDQGIKLIGIGLIVLIVANLFKR